MHQRVRWAMLVVTALLVPVSMAGASQGGWDTLAGGTFGTHATISSGLLEPGSGSAAIAFVRTQSGGTTTSGLFQTGYYRANAWTGGDCDRLTVLAYTATFVEWRNIGTAGGHCNTSTMGPPGNSLLGEIRTQGQVNVWQAFLNGATNFTPHTLNWSTGFAYGGAEVKNAGQVNQCIGCNPTAWQFATGLGGTGWTTGTQNNSFFFNTDSTWNVSLLTGGQFSVFH